MKQNKLNRRQFLVAVGASGAATAAVIGTAPQAAAPVAVAKGALTAPVKGYHLSDHIEKYYKTTEI